MTPNPRLSHARPFKQRLPGRQRGAALIIGLVLLMMLTVLTVSGMRAATLEITMAGNVQYAQNAFQAAETGIERAMAGVELTTEVQLAAHDLPDTTDSADTTT
ncbi:MAG: PilX N-terminal domain-containing pilus assembly protein, partial [Pseudomonadota bacterium]